MKGIGQRYATIAYTRMLRYAKSYSVRHTE